MICGAVSPKSETCETEPNAQKKRLKNYVFSQNSQETGFWLSSGSSEFFVYYSQCIIALIFTICVSWIWMSRLTFEKKTGSKSRIFKQYGTLIWSLLKKLSPFFAHFLVFLFFFWCISKSVRSSITPKLDIFHAIHVVSRQEQSYW